MSAFHRADWLSFVQSIVTVIAVVSAFGVARYTRHLDNKAETEKNRLRREKALALAGVAIEKAILTAGELQVAIRNGVMPPDRLDSAIDVLKDRRDRFAIVPFDEFTPNEAEAVEQARASMTKLISICQKERRVDDCDYGGAYPINHEIEMVARELERYRDKVRPRT